jgi:hypothetical protein
MFKTTTFCLLAALLLGNTTTASAQFTQNGQRISTSLEDDWVTDPNTGNSAWRSFSRSTYTYPSATALGFVTENWDTISSSFKNSYKYTITLNANNSFNNFIVQGWVGNAWVNSNRATYTYYNNDPQKELIVTLDTATAAGVFGAAYRTNNTYNASGLKTQQLTEVKGSGAAWISIGRESYINGANGLPTQTTSASYYNNIWNDNQQNFYTYNVANLVLSDIEKTPNFGTPITWGNALQTLNTYGGTNNNLTQKVQNNWDGMAWIPYTKEINTYNAANAQTRELQQEHNGTDYYDVASTDYTLNTYNNPTIELYKKLNSSTDLLENDRRIINTYSIINGTEKGVEKDAIKVQIFPNPTTDVLNIVLPNEQNAAMLLTDNQGRLVLTQNLTQQQTSINTDNLAKGNYNITIFQNGNMTTKRFIRQ